MKRIIYSSKARAGLDRADMEDILDAARRNNRKLGITGMLLFGSGKFIQVLEGDDDMVDRLVMHIEQDERHTDVEIIYDSTIDARAFTLWDMAYQVLADENPAALGGTMGVSDADELIARIRQSHHFARTFVAECVKSILHDAKPQTAPEMRV